MSFVEFVLQTASYGFRVALHNVVWLWVHREDKHVRSW